MYTAVHTAVALAQRSLALVLAPTYHGRSLVRRRQLHWQPHICLEGWLGFARPARQRSQRSYPHTGYAISMQRGTRGSTASAYLEKRLVRRWKAVHIQLELDLNQPDLLRSGL